MRERSFRGKRTDTKEWVHGYLVEKNIIRSQSPLIYYPETQQAHCHAHKVDPETVGEYIPKMDFYEGDVLHGYVSGDFGTILSEWVGIVKYDESTGRIRIVDDSGDWYETDDFVFDKVLGNVHDHPEFQMIDPNY